MKNIKTLCALTAVVLFTACYNPYSSTSQERPEETTVLEHGEAAHGGGEHGAGKPADKGAHGGEGTMHSDTSVHSGAAMHSDSTMHSDSIKHK